TEPGLYVGVLHVWERPIDAISDPEIREVALGGPDTSLRTEVVAQVELLAVTGGGANPSCATTFPEWDALLGATPPQMQVRLAAGSSDDPCSIPEDAGFRGLDNHLYRVQVHTGNFAPGQPGAVDPAAIPTFKWSRDNGSMVASWLEHDGSVVLTIDRLGPGGTQGFAPGDWIEITNDQWELAGQPGITATVTDVGATTLTLDDPTMAAQLTAAFAPDTLPQPRIRRWEGGEARPLAVQPAELGTGDVTADGWIRLESGIEVLFTPGVARHGAFWQIPARTAALPGTVDRQLDWPVDPATNTYAMRDPDGIAHHYARLALLNFSGTTWERLDDCRPQFPPLTELPEPVTGGGCGEIAIEPGTNLTATLLEQGVARLDADGALRPFPGFLSLAICFRPGTHTLGNVSFARWRSLKISATEAQAATLRGRIRIRRTSYVHVHDVRIVDLNPPRGPTPAGSTPAGSTLAARTPAGRRIAAVDDQGDVAMRWRTRVLEVTTATDVTIERVTVEFNDPRWRLKDGQAIHIADARDARVRDCVIEVPRGQNGIRIQNVDRAIVEGNRVIQDWGRQIMMDGLTGAERRELGSWVGRLLIDFGDVHLNPGSVQLFSARDNQPMFDRQRFEVGVGPGGQAHWAAEAAVLGFSGQSLSRSLASTRATLAVEATSLMRNLHTILGLNTLLPAGTSTSNGDIRVVRHILQDAWHTRRAALGTAIISGGELPTRLQPLRTRLVSRRGRWNIGLGGTGIRVAHSEPTIHRGSMSVRGNWVDNFSVGIEATWRQAGVAQDDIQRIDVCENILRLHSPLLPVQRGGIIAGGARRVRVSHNDIDIREGSSYGINRSRGWFVGVDGIRLRGRVGAWVGAQGNHVRGAAVGLRRTETLAVDPMDASPTRVLALDDNAFVGCDTDVL
ncbi:MAG: hypothetical protein JKY37_28490, partial [Nannocystaceae bacterium]|nr:hypothetical protein [Nannocystaceae bacterium]